MNLKRRLLTTGLAGLAVFVALRLDQNQKEIALAADASFDLQGHRGTRGLRPENTLAAFAHALTLGVSTLELDTALTKDGILVVTHDSELNPDITRDAKGEWLTKTGPSMFSMTYAEILRYDVGRIKSGTPYAMRFKDQVAVEGQRIPKLSDVFALVKKSGNTKVRFNIETKLDPRTPNATPNAQAFAEAVIKEIRRAGMEKRSTIQSFDWSTLNVVKKMAPEIATVCLTTQQGNDDNIGIGKPGPSAWLGGLDVDDFGGSVPKVVKAAGGDVWSPNFGDVNEALVKEAHGLGLLVIPWTANDPADMARLIEMGVDGLISDRPDLLRTVLTEKGRTLPKATPVQP
ncbi:MAG: glycerophosphodiester phosphodiesterase [Vicinamibacteria bacterium]